MYTKFFPNEILLAKNYCYVYASKTHGVLTCYKKNLVLKKWNSYIMNSTETTIFQFQIFKAIIKLANVYIAPLEEIYSLIHSIIKDTFQNEHIIIIGDLDFAHVAKQQCTKGILLIHEKS